MASRTAWGPLILLLSRVTGVGSCCPRLFQLGLDLRFGSEKAFSMWVVLGQVRGQRSFANSEICPIISEQNQFLSQSHSLVKGCIMLSWDRWERDCLAQWSLLYQEGWRPVTEQCTRTVVLISTSVISPLQGSGLPVPEHLLPLSRHPPLCWDIYPIFSIPSEGNVPSPAPTCILTPLSTAKYQLAIGNVEVTWLQPTATFSSDPSLAP